MIADADSIGQAVTREILLTYGWVRPWYIALRNINNRCYQLIDLRKNYLTIRILITGGTCFK